MIEDDYDAEHRYDRAPVAALAAIAPEHVVYVGSVSKTLAPALRLGWVVAPPHVREELVVRKQWSDITSPALGQLALAELITSGGFERHLRAVRTRQRSRRDAVVAALREHLPDARVHGVAAGLHLVVGLPDGVDDAAVAERALAAGVAVQPLSYHRLRPGPPGLVIGYAATAPDRLREGVAAAGGRGPGGPNLERDDRDPGVEMRRRSAGRRRRRRSAPRPGPPARPPPPRGARRRPRRAGRRRAPRRDPRRACREARHRPGAG